ncbi:hypothetical protein T4C_6228 [Trichinella pseudospiralis]|uniref:FLYWCH-type domain-containing protein n=1 Tax=Trichinella pseudospiralis TaxID=6337 RepID=A0A0V1K5R8_TRIPS|nr:hypothetical protein T4C_6228 [Trichinella pseudospiralis]
MNRRKAAKKLIVVMSITISKCTARVTMQVNKQMYTFWRCSESFTCSEPAKSNPTRIGKWERWCRSFRRKLAHRTKRAIVELPTGDAGSDASFDRLAASDYPKAKSQGCQAQRPGRRVGGAGDDGGTRAASSVTVSLPLLKDLPCPRMETKPRRNPHRDGPRGGL